MIPCNVMNFMSQVIFSFITPFAVWLFIGYLLTAKAGLEKWAMAVCIVIGVVSGVVSMFKYIITAVDHVAGDKNRSAENGENTVRKRVDRKAGIKNEEEPGNS